ncbi:hypothetical protein D3870_09690 [Noviherbaspirillum cavernae]|uniref:Phage tail tape measure protein n=1 Tax=Noviherbaspirillum cavernae TaxID=2320862 RepID=A0A418X1C9_9BURK|nr:hypothetical protein [Noviherbaspirillum cavernae]RJG06245.1 hypothetical protein D3870_09690 [Noviherbaspirillum cavernae]
MSNKFHLQAIISAVDKISPALKGIRQGINATHKTFRDLGGASRGLLGSLGVPASLSFAAVAFGAQRAAQASLDYAGAIQDAAEVTGMQVEQLQSLQTVFSAAGVEADGVNEAMTKLNKGMADGAAGKDKGFAELFQRLGIPLRNARGEITSVEEALPALADAFARNENPALRTRMAMELFGKSGAKMIPILAQGRDGIRKMQEEAARLGTVVTKDSIGALDEMGDEIGLVMKQVRSQTAELFGEMAPFLTPIITDVKEWIAANKDLIRSEVGAWVRDVAESVKAWVAGGGLTRLKEGIGDVVSGIGTFISAIGGVKNLLLGLGALILIGPVASMGQLLMVFGRMATYVAPLLLKAFLMVGKGMLLMGRAMLTTPIGIIAAAIAGAAYLIYANWDKIGPWAAALWEQLGGYFSAGWELLKTVFGWSPLGLIINNWEPIVGWFSSLWDRISGFVDPILQAGKAVSGWVGGDESLPAGQQGMAASRSGVGAGGPLSGLQAGANRTPLASAGAMSPSANLKGEMRVRFENAPPGMRVEQGTTNQRSVAFNPDVGYRLAY